MKDNVTAETIRIAGASVTYYYLREGFTVACVGNWAARAMFRLRTDSPSTGPWEFLDPNSPSWDWIHQSIFNTGRASLLDSTEIERLPALPEHVEVTLKSREDFRRPEMPLSAKDYPAICQKLRSIGADKIPVYVVLIEDTYETYHGDGRFHDVYSVYLEKAVAVDLVEATGSGEQRTAYRQNAYLREMVISVSNGEVGIEEFHLEPFDTTRVATVVDALEKQLGKGGSS